MRSCASCCMLWAQLCKPGADAAASDNDDHYDLDYYH
jgi:hypothetical protein